jgi:hypothetical protein
MKQSLALTAILAVALCGASSASEWHVAPSGTVSGAGTAASPWDFCYAMSGYCTSIKPGDTVWVHGGNYTKASATGTNYADSAGIAIQLRGTSAAPIKVTNYNGERATINALMDCGFNCSQPNYVTITGLEVVTRGFSAMKGFEIGASTGAHTCVGVKVINCIVHDCGPQKNQGSWGNYGGGFGAWLAVEGCEVHGNLVYNNGVDDSDRGHGHGLYVQSQADAAGPMVFKNNIVFRNFDNGYQVYGSSAAPRTNVTMTQNVMFNDGEISELHGMNGVAEIWHDGGQTSINPKVIGEMTYARVGSTGGAVRVCNSSNGVFSNNFFCTTGAPAGNVGLYWGTSNSGATGSNNTVIGAYANSSATMLGSTLIARPTSGLNVFVLKNDYETGRGNIIVYNWGKASTVDADVSSVLSSGDMYEVRDAQNWFAAAPVMTGTYSGGSITIPMTGLTVGAPVGYTMVFPHTAPEFGTFVVRKTGAGSVVVYGDANGDGVFGMADINQMVDWLLSRSTPPVAGAAKFTASDVNGDNQLTMADLNLMVDRLLGRITKFPVQP